MSNLEVLLRFKGGVFGDEGGRRGILMGCPAVSPGPLKCLQNGGRNLKLFITLDVFGKIILKSFQSVLIKVVIL